MFAAGSIDLLFLDRLCSWQWQRAGTVSSTRWQMSSLKVMSYLRWKGTRPISRVDEEKSPFHHFNIHTITITAIPWRSERVEAVGFQSFLYEQRVRICFQSHQNNRAAQKLKLNGKCIRHSGVFVWNGVWVFAQLFSYPCAAMSLLYGNQLEITWFGSYIWLTYTM